MGTGRSYKDGRVLTGDFFFIRSIMYQCKSQNADDAHTETSSLA
jgi:hypothetical protein